MQLEDSKKEGEGLQECQRNLIFLNQTFLNGCIYRFFLLFANLCKFCCDTKPGIRLGLFNADYLPNTVYRKCECRQVYY